MDTFLLLVISVLLGLVLYEIGRIFERNMHQPPPKYTPSKNLMMNKDSDMYALYYTDMLYPVYGRETILTIQRAYRDCTHKAFDLEIFGISHASEADKKNKEIEWRIQEMYKITLEKNLTLMMQANLDVLNGKISIEEARRQTVNAVDINNAMIPPLASRQIAIDVHAGVGRPMYEYLDFNFLNKLNKERQKQHSQNDTQEAALMSK